MQLSSQQVFGYLIPLVITILVTLYAAATASPQYAAYAGAISLIIHILTDIQQAGPPSAKPPVKS